MYLDVRDERARVEGVCLGVNCGACDRELNRCSFLKIGNWSLGQEWCIDEGQEEDVRGHKG